MSKEIISLRLPAELLRAIEAEAEKERRPRSFIIQEALEKTFKVKPGKKQQFLGANAKWRKS